MIGCLNHELFGLFFVCIFYYVQHIHKMNAIEMQMPSWMCDLQDKTSLKMITLEEASSI